MRIQRGAVGIADTVHPLLGKLLAGPVDRLHFLGTGGAQILMLPAAQLLQSRSTFDVRVQYAAEVVAERPVGLDESSLVVVPSLSGTTKESIEVLAQATTAGATTLSLTGHADSPIAGDAHHNYTNFAEDDTSSESFYLQSLVIALSVMAHRGELADFDGTIEQLRTLPESLADAKEAFEPTAEELAQQIAAGGYHLFTGAGTTWPQAWYYGMCILEEMQWIRTRPVHASDFFHGTLELVEPGVSVFVFHGEDSCRPLTDRVQNFAERYTDRLRVLDSRSVDLPGLSAGVRALVSPVVLAALLERVSARLEELRDHPLTTRRYYKRVQY